MEITQELLDRSEAIQKDKVAFIDALLKKQKEAGGKPGIYEDLVNVYLYAKIAELELEVERLKSL